MSDGTAARYLNRELSEVAFIARVLELAGDDEQPLLERAKFLAICSDNTDEFFQVRVAGLQQLRRAGVSGTSADGMTPSEQLAAVREAVEDLVTRQTRVFGEHLVPGLREAGIDFCGWESLDADDRKHLQAEFDERIFPVLTPLAIDARSPFPHISNLSLNLAVAVADPDEGERWLARVKVPPLLPRFIVLPDGHRFVPLEQVIAAHLDRLFPGMQILEHHVFRVTRSAEMAIEESDADDLLTTVETEVLRRRFGDAVRLEIEPSMSAEVRAQLVEGIDVGDEDIYTLAGPLDLSGLWALYDLERPDLKEPSWTPTVPPRLDAVDGSRPDVFGVVAERDLLVHHPYESFESSVQSFIEQAADDPDVLAIKQTLYRTSESESPIVEALIRAAESGKQVVALVELKARFDEEANIARARTLEEAGVHVVYGLVGLKTHTKTALVVREENGRLRRYAHVGTGNYNPKTARIYEDLGLLTTDPDVGADLSELFNALTGFSRQSQYRKLLVAPVALRERVLELIRREGDRENGRIVAKVNNLVDTEVIDALYDASSAGAEVDLVVRSICCLRPGVPGMSERIRVRSVVGRYLEHSRIIRFGDPEKNADYLIGSADLMPRNLDRRVEAVVPVEDADIKARLEQVLRVLLDDDQAAWELGADGDWRRVATTDHMGTHDRLQALARERAGGAQPSVS
ncbi:MAG: polyphosphate kinase 1 [Actinobacteria bacterium]|nr:polyphosphate kinase 1 [Actinomycetota bacterium]